jgi:methylmalonyl-CoA/ethylmalonyl-CoA epimerase
MFTKVAHIGIAVKDLQKSAELFSKLFDVQPAHTQEVSDQKVRVTSFHIGETTIELTAATE